MINIAKKKLPMAVIGIFVYLSYCAMSMYVMRGDLAYYGYNLTLAAWFANDVWAFFLGGIIPTVVFYLLAWFVFRSLSIKVGGDIASIRYGVCLTVIAANILLFAIKFIYIAVPLYAPVINTIIDPVITLGAVALYLWYAFKMDYVDKSRFRQVAMYIMGAFLAAYGLAAIVSLITSLAA
ncbi:MAG: hypothetical protein J1G04_02910 [Clostridiales bacterium]|nr:hypothetical protein [Clostridiales bacterium]